MTDGTNLDIAADVIAPWYGEDSDVRRAAARFVLDAIHPALADLTPDDVETLIDLAVCVDRYENDVLGDPVSWRWGYVADAIKTVPAHAWEVLSRD